jgi:hypothetical protein
MPRLLQLVAFAHEVEDVIVMTKPPPHRAEAPLRCTRAHFQGQGVSGQLPGVPGSPDGQGRGRALVKGSRGGARRGVAAAVEERLPFQEMAHTMRRSSQCADDEEHEHRTP